MNGKLAKYLKEATQVIVLMILSIFSIEKTHKDLYCVPFYFWPGLPAQAFPGLAAIRAGKSECQKGGKHFYIQKSDKGEFMAP